MDLDRLVGDIGHVSIQIARTPLVPMCDFEVCMCAVYVFVLCMHPIRSLSLLEHCVCDCVCLCVNIYAHTGRGAMPASI